MSLPKIARAETVLTTALSYQILYNTCTSAQIQTESHKRKMHAQNLSKPLARLRKRISWDSAKIDTENDPTHICIQGDSIH
jgi:hypothetical protein